MEAGTAKCFFANFFYSFLKKLILPPAGIGSSKPENKKEEIQIWLVIKNRHEDKTY